MHTATSLPSVVLICHERDSFDRDGLARWLACSMQLAGIVVIRDGVGRLRRAARHEIRRSGWLGLADVLAYRLFDRLWLARRNAAWMRASLAELGRRFHTSLDGVPQIVVRDPNSELARTFLAATAPDLLIARCKFILKPETFGLAKKGAFAIHPGICPEYRNAHGCFWALANRDLDRVGMTLLRLDKGVDTGPIFLQAGCEVDERRDTHTIVQYRAVLDNLAAIGHTLLKLGRGEDIAPVPVEGRRSAAWGQPRLTTYARWQWLARQERRALHDRTAVS
jgi:hypothetical protein